MVYVFLADGFEDIEALAPIDILRRANVDVKTVGVTGKEVTSSHGVTVKADISVSDIKLDSDLELIVLPGGMPGTLNLKACELLTAAVKAFDQVGKGVAAICAAPSILAELGILTNRPATSNPNFQHVLVENGAILSEEPAVVDSNVITSKGMATAIPFGLEIVRWFLGDAAVEDLKPRIVLEG